MYLNTLLRGGQMLLKSGKHFIYDQFIAECSNFLRDTKYHSPCTLYEYVIKKKKRLNRSFESVQLMDNN